MPDQQIACTACGRRFTWSAGEQAFYRERGLQAPRRCPDCRAGRRQQTATPAARPAAAPRLPARRASPHRRFGLSALAVAAALSLALLLIIPAGPLLAWLIAVNLIALLAYGYDKAIAGGEALRVPETVLLGLALAGGSPGAFAAMLIFRHKISKPAFLVPFGLIVALQVGLIIAWPLIGLPG